MMNMINPYEAESRFDLAMSEISSDMIQQFHRHWLQICGNGRLPRVLHDQLAVAGRLRGDRGDHQPR